MADDLLTTAEVSALTGLSVATINRWAAAGKLRVARQLPGRTGDRLYRRVDIRRARLLTSPARGRDLDPPAPAGDLPEQAASA